jgi:hypothetical protein
LIHGVRQGKQIKIKKMKKLSIEQISLVEGGSWKDMWTIAGGACGAAVSGVFFGGVGLAVSAAIFGPNCIGLSIGAALGAQIK